MITKPIMILFDYGDTLIQESQPDFLRGWQAVFQYVDKNPYGATPEQAERVAAQLWERYFISRRSNSSRSGVEVHEWQMLRTILNFLGVGVSQPLTEIEKALWDNTVSTSPTPHLHGLLEYVRGHDIRTGVISNIGWSGRALQKQLQRLFPDHTFEFILASSEYGIRKPDPMLFQIALKKAGLPASAVWFCGDNIEKDICGSHSVGMFPVHYQGAKSSKACQETPSFPYLSIADWDDLLPFLKNDFATSQR